MQLQALSFRTLVQLPCFFNLPPSKQPKDVMTRHLHNRHPSVTVKSLPRRVLLQLMGFGPISLCIYPVCAAPMQEMKDPEVIRVQDFEATQWGENSSTVDQFSGESSPVTLPLDENQIIKGLKDVLTGMRVGGKRRALIPPSVGYIKENLEPIPDEVSLPVLLIMLSSELSSSPSFGFISILEPAISLHSDSLCRNQVFNKAFSHQVIYFCYILLLSTAVWSSA
ncbi:peptidyl-prolyl cis-trans isomerase FKBP16-1, chloroplastic isoform X2 [Durio zibethinus]|uniref:peptidylprolyl isomerase n=1 Tax=Durio zibethinus TaxID=66656 RepID=A0A6P5WKL9_DURZI|nr:peptidyl-prolyl cis-trans isomerase FKBP16-1, chloroplastic isoform X2 [Durio zibethinus]